MLGIRYCADQKFAHRKFHFDDELVWSSSYVCLFVIFLLLYLKFELLLLLWWECRNKINQPTSDKTEKMSWLTQSAVALLHFLMTRWQTKSRLSSLSNDAGNYHYVSITIIISIIIIVESSAPTPLTSSSSRLLLPDDQMADQVQIVAEIKPRSPNHCPEQKS